MSRQERPQVKGQYLYANPWYLTSNRTLTKQKRRRHEYVQVRPCLNVTASFIANTREPKRSHRSGLKLTGGLAVSDHCSDHRHRQWIRRNSNRSYLLQLPLLSTQPHSSVKNIKKPKGTMTSRQCQTNTAVLNIKAQQGHPLVAEVLMKLQEKADSAALV